MAIGDGMTMTQLAVFLAIVFGYSGFMVGRWFELRFEGRELRYLDNLNRHLVAHSGNIEVEMLQYSNALHEIDSYIEEYGKDGSCFISTAIIRQMVQHGLNQ